jgi:antitoxin component YwqK of YwqJK toxin-antitoxin module
MALQGRSVIKALLSLGLSILCMVACDRRQPHRIAIPSIYVQVSDEALNVKEGVMYYQNQPFSGWQYELYRSGDTAVLVPFFHGKEEGLACQWYPNGRLKEQRLYEKGEKEGNHKGWWENGNKSFEYHFRKGFHEGNQKEWNESGTLAKDLNYKNGKEDGFQRLWRTDGKLMANYVAKNGRNYGLTGVKNCKSVWEDESTH